MGTTWEGETKMSPEVNKEVEKAKKFVERNIVPADNSRVACSDGRYTPEQSNGAIRVFGGGFGVLAAGEKEVIYPDYHTDTHTKEHGGRLGCGHIKRLINEEGMAKTFEEFSAKGKETVLEGEHQEKGVLLVYSSDYSVNSFDGENMYFVVDVGRIEKLFKDPEAFKTYQDQMGKTAHMLAQGKPMFKVDIDADKKASVSFLKKVE